jgi:hypothetical protein
VCTAARGLAQEVADEEEQLALMTAGVAVATAVSLVMNRHARLLLAVADSGHTVAIVAKYKPRIPSISLIVPTITRASNMTSRVKGHGLELCCG